MRAAAGIAWAPILAPSHAAPCPLRQLERHFRSLAGLKVDAAENVGEVVGVVGEFIVVDDVVRPGESSITAQHVELALTTSGNRVFSNDEIGGGRIARPWTLLERDLVG